MIQVGYNLLDWIAALAGRNPVTALDICEKLAGRLKDFKPPLWIGHAEPLIVALTSILREADETDDEEFIRRAVRLQDQFLKMSMPNIGIKHFLICLGFAQK